MKNPAFEHESGLFGGGGWVLIFCVGIFINVRTDMYTVKNEALTAVRYRDEILTLIVVPYTAVIRDEFLLVDNNALTH